MNSPTFEPSPQTAPDSQFKQIPIAFPADGLTLKGTLHLPANAPSALVVGSHGLFATAASPKQLTLAQTCNRLGIAYFRFDHRGCGESQGDFRQETTLQGRARDILAAVDAVRPRCHTPAPLGLFGSSLGGAASIAASLHLDVQAMVTVAAPVRSRTIDPAAVAPLDPGGDSRRVDPQRLQFDIRGSLDRLRRVLVFHGDADEVVPFDNALEIIAAAEQPKELVRFHGGDHRMSAPADQAAFLRTAGQWFFRHLVSIHKRHLLAQSGVFAHLKSSK